MRQDERQRLLLEGSCSPQVNRMTGTRSPGLGFWTSPRSRCPLLADSGHPSPQVRFRQKRSWTHANLYQSNPAGGHFIGKSLQLLIF